jgi:hypothetical protein
MPPPRIETQQESLGDSFPFLNSIGVPLHRQRRTRLERPADIAASTKPIIRFTGRLFPYKATGLNHAFRDIARTAGIGYMGSEDLPS